MGLALHVILCWGWLLCGLSPKYFVVGSLLWLDWGMVSRGPFELDTFVYLEFLYNSPVNEMQILVEPRTNCNRIFFLANHSTSATK